jgi:YD repeat-containing protein
MTNTIKEYDTNGNIIHSRDSDGYEVWCEYDNNGKCIHFRDSDGYEVWYDYDTNGKLINTRNTSGATGHHHAAAEEKVRGECAAEQELAKVRGEYWEVVRKNLELLQRAERAEAERDAAKKEITVYKDVADMNYRGFEREKAKVADAERAEADANEVREAFKRVSMEMDRAERRQREMGEHGKRWEERARKAEAALADAKRKGAYEALTKFEERVFWYPGCLATLGNIRAFRDSLYAPTPARSVTLKRVWSREVVITWDAQRSNYVKDGRAYETLVRLMESLEQTAMTPLSPTEYTALCALAEGK